MVPGQVQVANRTYNETWERRTIQQWQQQTVCHGDRNQPTINQRRSGENGNRQTRTGKGVARRARQKCLNNGRYGWGPPHGEITKAQRTGSG